MRTIKGHSIQKQNTIRIEKSFLIVKLTKLNILN